MSSITIVGFKKYILLISIYIYLIHTAYIDESIIRNYGWSVSFGLIINSNGNNDVGERILKRDACPR